MAWGIGSRGSSGGNPALAARRVLGLHRTVADRGAGGAV